ncbi:hypothetical protein I601_1048 [Nocardioides dokdonensis FR1436]|uniref:SipW-cognate class signal peptide n=1 Tax=Nocardioides dokdonensis FR1436 TaxID=1300347 RepID=A0A1A9GII0_9ACTN|nr:SipW-dependent-type signal peptide-containing protein [Nocardioides dokdonensis]ANH37490.1 hypothetical protein I601_1048 [Nocardioides dokdonensis FR1436]
MGMLLAVGFVGTLGGATTLAYWNDTATVQGGTATAGSLDVKVDGQQGNPTTYTWMALQMTEMAPGEIVAASLPISNAGTTPFTFTVSGTATGVAGSGGASMLPQVTVKVRVGGTASAKATAYPRKETCSGGTETFSAVLDGTAKPVVPTGAVMVPGGSTSMCVTLELAAGAPNTVQGASMTPTFVVTATQS